MYRIERLISVGIDIVSGARKRGKAGTQKMHDREASRSIVTVNQEPYWNLWCQ